MEVVLAHHSFNNNLAHTTVKVQQWVRKKCRFEKGQSTFMGGILAGGNWQVFGMED